MGAGPDLAWAGCAMIYKRSSAQPRKLLRLAAPASVVALLGAAAAVCGSVDASDSDVFVGGGVVGIGPAPDDAASDAHVITGVVVNPGDASDQDVQVHGVVVHPDASDE